MSEPTADDYRTKLRELIKRVPVSVNTGGHGFAVAYKKAVGEAQKLIASPRATAMNLKACLAKLNIYYV